MAERYVQHKSGVGDKWKLIEERICNIDSQYSLWAVLREGELPPTNEGDTSYQQPHSDST